jgi:hypothetical protein
MTGQLDGVIAFDKAFFKAGFFKQVSGLKW